MRYGPIMLILFLGGIWELNEMYKIEIVHLITKIIKRFIN